MGIPLEIKNELAQVIGRSAAQQVRSCMHVELTEEARASVGGNAVVAIEEILERLQTASYIVAYHNAAAAMAKVVAGR